MTDKHHVKDLANLDSDRDVDAGFPVPSISGICLEVARGFLPRLRGLIGRPALPANCGLVLTHCRTIHTCWMLFPIDLVFFDRDLTVIKLVRQLSPGRFAFCVRAEGVVELSAGSIDRLGLQLGACLRANDEQPASRRRLASPSHGSDRGKSRSGYLLAFVLMVSGCASPVFHQPARVNSTIDAAAPRGADEVESGRFTAAMARSKPSPVNQSTSERISSLQIEAEQAYQTGKLTDALSAFTQLTQLQADPRAAWLRVGNIHHQRGELGQAIRAYRMAARGGDTDAISVQTRAKALFNIAVIGLEQAREALDTMVTLPLDPRLRRESGELDRSLSHSRQLLAQQHRRVEASRTVQPVAEDSGGDVVTGLDGRQRVAEPRDSRAGELDSPRSGDREKSVEVIRGQVSR